MPAGPRIRRCGVCKHCLNPAGKQVCLQLRAKKEQERQERLEELARRFVLEMNCECRQAEGKVGLACIMGMRERDCIE